MQLFQHCEHLWDSVQNISEQTNKVFTLKPSAWHLAIFHSQYLLLINSGLLSFFSDTWTRELFTYQWFAHKALIFDKANPGASVCSSAFCPPSEEQRVHIFIFASRRKQSCTLPAGHPLGPHFSTLSLLMQLVVWEEHSQAGPIFPYLLCCQARLPKTHKLSQSERVINKRQFCVVFFLLVVVVVEVFCHSSRFTANVEMYQLIWVKINAFIHWFFIFSWLIQTVRDIKSHEHPTDCH